MPTFGDIYQTTVLAKPSFSFLRSATSKRCGFISVLTTTYNPPQWFLPILTPSTVQNGALDLIIEGKQTLVTNEECILLVIWSHSKQHRAMPSITMSNRILIESQVLLRREASASCQKEARNSSEKVERMKWNHTESLRNNCGSLSGVQEASG